MSNSIPIIKGGKRKPGEKKKKVDYRKWAKKYLKDGGNEVLGMQPFAGMGPGRRRWCNKCGGTPQMTTYKTDGHGYCGKCGEQIIEYMGYDYYKKLKLEQLKKYIILRPFLNLFDKILQYRAKKDTRTAL